MLKNQYGKKIYSIPEIYGITVKAVRSVKYLILGKKAGLMDSCFQERLMLAVTAVNQCAMCSYAHTEMALKAGLSQEEVKDFLSGEFPDIPPGQVKAVLFAQHYADRRGHPKKEMWNEIEDTYGKDGARCILAAIRLIMFGNSTGIVLGSIRDRVSGRRGDPRSSVCYELAFIILFLPLFLLAVLQGLLANVFHFPIIRFS